ncbi:hypothetical protein ONZ45_g1852 [Pleurotus djamor]|nr:hypothetical protein ONZ45_g1852 [Pleurotus djamor]
MSVSPNDDPDASSQYITAPPRLASLPSPLGGLDTGPGLTIPLTPITPITPTTPLDPNTPAEGSSRSKKTNPLTDLIETEKTYVELLTGIIRKVAAAWSRSNLPPPDLDTMFRSIEGVYKANRSLLLKLKEIGTNPSSPKALGDLLMRWIDDLETPYTTYCTKYRCGFDEWEPVRSNSRLPGVISIFSEANPPPLSAVSNPESSSVWTLDALFLLPKGRLKYYKKLYSRLLKSTTPGRSDHRLLLGAIEKLEKLLEILDSRQSLKVGQPVNGHAISEPLPSDVNGFPASATEPVASSSIHGTVTPVSEMGSSAQESNFSGTRSSQDTEATTLSRASSTTMTMPISDLEHRLSTSRTLDIFTMKPKVVRLQMLPPHLPFTREMRLSVDAVIRFTPRNSDTEVVHQRGHIFLLSDLFLVCERMTPDERLENGAADMWLSYPPLAGKVLRLSDVPGQDNALNVAIMRKETLTIELESVPARNNLMSQLKACVDFASTVAPVPKQPPPPMPPLPQNASLPPGASIPDRSRSPPSNGSHSNQSSFHQHMNGPPNGVITEPPSNGMRPLDGMMQSPHRSVPPHPIPGQASPPRSMSAAGQHPPGPPNPARFPPGGLPGQPPFRSPSAGPPIGVPPRAPSAGPPGGVPPRAPSAGPPPNHPGPHWQPMPNQPFPGRGRPPFGPPGAQFPEGMPPNAPGPFPRSNVGLPNHPGPPDGRGPPDQGYQGGLRKSPSSRSLTSQFEQQQSQHAPPLPPFPGGHPPNPSFSIPRSNSQGSLSPSNSRSMLPSLHMGSRTVSLAGSSFADPSPPDSPVEEMPRPTGPVTSTISAQMKCKVFLQQQHAQWKSLGSSKLKLYRQDPTNIKQLVVEADKDKAILISTIVLTDGVERVGKTGVAIELSDNGARTGMIYMIQLRNEASANGLFESLLAGSDRAIK